MHLDKLLDSIYLDTVRSSFDGMDILSIHCDSRKVTDGSLFVALQGSTHNGADFIKDAIRRGATAVAVSQDTGPLQGEHKDVCFLTVDDPKEFLHEAVRRFYGNPSSAVRTIGITGTNGKTTVAYLVESVLEEAAKPCGVIGTVNYRWGNYITPAVQTTPDFVDNQRFLTDLAGQHVPYCVMEVSSHALAQDRVYGIDFCTAVFTNLTSDHLDYHRTRENYFSAKAQLFTVLTSENTAIINTDDLYGRQLVSMTEAKIMSYGVERPADVMAKDIQMNISGSHFTLTCSAGEIEIQTKLIGNYNIYNILAAVSVCLAEKITLDTIKKGIEHLSGVPGRLERIEQGQDFSIFIDYAHTQDALENVLTAVRQVSQSRIILVFGCGGDRDRSKRPLMGQAAGRLADWSIVTSDNPRSEEPKAIIDQIVPGFERDNYTVVINREEAIKHALGTAQSRDIVLIAGKGHETYQIFGGERIDFSERRVIEKYLLCSQSRK